MYFFLKFSDSGSDESEFGRATAFLSKNCLNHMRDGTTIENY